MDQQQPAVKAPTAEEKSGLLMAISQLDMLVAAFGGAPDRVKNAAKEFRNSLQEWADTTNA